jgi:hypothetical protein
MTAPGPVAASSASRWPRHPRVLELPAWSWLEELSQKHGQQIRLKDVSEEELDRVCAPGFDLIWLMGLWQRSPAARAVARRQYDRFQDYDRLLPGWTLEHIVGSPYAVADYRPDPRIGSWPDVDRFRRRLHRRGVGLILDFVPNHTAIDHPWVRQYPQRFLAGTLADYRSHPDRFLPVESREGRVLLLAHGRDPNFPPWRDTLQLHPLRADTRHALTEVVRHLGRHCDGLRCDMAMLVLEAVFRRTWGNLTATEPPPSSEIWEELIAAAPHLLWIAEAYWALESRLLELGFHFAYDKTFYDLLRSGTPAACQQHLQQLGSGADRFVRFLENHDEQRAAAVFAAPRLRAAIVALATAPGMRLFLHGQMQGRRIRAPVELATVAEEPPDEELERYYNRVLRLTREEILRNGSWEPLPVLPVDGERRPEELLAWQWRLAPHRLAVVINFADHTVQGRVRLGADRTDQGYRLEDRLNETAYFRSGQELADGLYVRLDAGQAHLFDVALSS